MNIDQFWAIMESAKNADEPEVPVGNALAGLSVEELVSYQEHFDTLHANAYRWDVWGAAYIRDGGCSDDGFTDFRYGLISLGREIYEAALADPDSLAAVDEGVEIANETFGYIALEAYEKKTGKDMPRNPHRRADPVGENWDFDDDDECRARLPRLWKMFGA